uniref:Protein of unassigned function n=1 Tax=Methylobacterium oryzae CBMB20 TaxID=693986 RepID=A0A088B348_9HYPH|nr:cell wall hydrolase [Methylobacterium oryzae]AGO88381.1 protein of unassigned function [Methylobacterium oryzae CBMB20]
MSTAVHQTNTTRAARLADVARAMARYGLIILLATVFLLGSTQPAGKPVTLTREDVKVIAKVVTTEVDLRLNDLDLRAQIHAVIDTMLNRLASGRWGKTMKSVADSPWQFSRINGPSWAYGSVDKMPDLAVSPKVAAEVQRWLARRESGAPSSVGDAMNYLNPAFSSTRAVNGWGRAVLAQAEQNGHIFGSGRSKHYHGTAADLMRYRPGPLHVRLAPGARTIGLLGKSIAGRTTG